MGGFFSFARSPNAAETKAILNNLLKEMFTRTDLIDLYSLADPDQCNRYIVVATTALDKLFIKINLEPKEGPKGTFYFQRIDGLQKANPMQSQQSANCRKLAFFFIRIFQIYAALTISILDTDLTRDPDEKAPEERQERLQAVRFHEPPRVPGFGQAAAPSRERRGLLGYFGFGGALNPTGPWALGGDYAILNTYLKTPDATDTAFMEFNGESNLRIRKATLYQDNPTNPQLPGPPIAFSEEGNSPLIEYTMRINGKIIKSTGKLIITQHNDGTNGGVEIKLKDIFINEKSTGPFSKLLFKATSTDRSPMTKSGDEMPAVLKSMFKEGYAKVTPFSLVRFLQKHELLDGLEGKVPIGRTSVYISDPGNIEDGDEVPILYSGTTTVKMDSSDSRETKVSVRAALSIKRAEKDPGEKQKYTVSVIFKDKIASKPEKFAELLRPKDSRWREFYTGRDDSSKPVDKDGGALTTFLTDVFEELLKTADEGYTEGGIRYSSKGIPEPYDSSKIPPHLRIKELWGALAKRPPIKAHCSARALQLLSAAGITGESGTKASSVCRVKFPYIVNRSLPSVEAGNKLTSEYGIYALASLFIDTIEQGSPPITDAEEFKIFRRQFNEFFRGYQGIPEQTSQGLDTMQDSTLPFCQGHEKDVIDLSNDRGTLSQLQAKVRVLRNRQAIHVQNTMLLMFKLFDEDAIRAGRMEFNINILTGGINTVNTLAVEARKLLIEYYGDCEKTYKEGLVMLDNKPAGSLAWRQVDR